MTLCLVLISREAVHNMNREKNKIARTQSGHRVRAWRAKNREDTDISKPRERGNRIKDGGKRCEGCVNHHDERSRSQTNCRRGLEGIVNIGRWSTGIAIAKTRWSLGFPVRREKNREIPGKTKTITRRPRQYGDKH